MKDQLIFSTTLTDDSDNVGAHVRMGETGRLVTYSSVTEAGTISFTFVDGDVTPASDTINETAHGLEMGHVVQLTTTGTLPAGLATGTDYYVIRVDADNFKLAASLADAEAGNAVDITAAAGGGTHTVTQQEMEHSAMDVRIFGGNIEVDLDHTEDSIRLGDGTSFFTSTTVGPDIGLDVNIINASLTVNATDFDIRDLDASQDNVAISDGTDTLAINADGSLNITDNGGSLTVDATDLDIRDLSASQDNVAISDGTDTMAVNADGSINSVVTATDLDIRDLTHVSDSVRLGDGTSFFTSSTVGSDIGLDVFSINDPSVANTALANTATSVGTSATDLVATDLANRKMAYVYNNGNKKIFLGGASVTTSTGFPVSPGSYLDLRIGAAINLYAISTGAAQDTRIMEFS